VKTNFFFFFFFFKKKKNKKVGEARKANLQKFHVANQKCYKNKNIKTMTHQTGERGREENGKWGG
jgi:hypothetical protein